MGTNVSMDELLERSVFIKEWKNEQISHLRLKYGSSLNEKRVDKALNEIIRKKIYVPFAYLENNYLKKTAPTDLLSLIDFIEQNHPILGGNGVLFYQHKDRANPMLRWIESIMDGRGHAKSMREKYDKSDPMWAFWDAIQKNFKLQINSLYGGFGYRGFIFANIFLSTAVTNLGQSAISSAAMGFEAFLTDNCSFVQENEVLRFISFVQAEADVLESQSDAIFKNFTPMDNVTIVEKILKECIFKVSKSFKETLGQVVQNLTQNEKILLYFKNNLYAFCDTPIMQSYLKKLHIQIPELLVPNRKALTEEARDTIDFIWHMMYTFVVFDHPVFDRVRKNKYTYKKCVAYQDTDSNFLVLSQWVNYIKKCFPELVPQSEEGMKQFDFKVVNIVTMLVTNVVACSFATLCHSMNVDEEHTKKLTMKNEFYFSRVLFTTKKKRYIARPLLQEGMVIRYPKDLEIKGFDFIKNTTKPAIREFYERMSYEDILIPKEIDTEKILAKIMKFENDMIQSLLNGDTQYFKQSNIKAIREYKNPYSVQGIKGTLLWNTLNPTYAIQLPSDVDIIPINLEEGRRKVTVKPGGEDVAESVWMVYVGTNADGKKVYMNNRSSGLMHFAEKYPEEFERLATEILLNPNPSIRTMGLNTIARPKNDDIPRPAWLNDIMDTSKIVNDALSLFYPILKSLKIYIVKGSSNREHYSNIIAI